MKKKIQYLAFSLSLVLFGFMSFQVQAEPGRGSVEISRANAECVSGTEVQCSGDGNLCSKTIGFDCAPDVE